MRWTVSPWPRPGSLRIVTRFAWLPVNIDGTKVWFEPFYEEQEWRRMCDSTTGYSGFCWTPIRRHLDPK